MKITELQMEGRKRMDTSEFLKGHPVNVGSIFSEKR
ncbi:MAG TPA: hypothetical protein PLQ41_08290 [bacterium]|nr:hypothetical protein [bacterium]